MRRKVKNLYHTHRHNKQFNDTSHFEDSGSFMTGSGMRGDVKYDVLDLRDSDISDKQVIRLVYNQMQTVHRRLERTLPRVAQIQESIDEAPDSVIAPSIKQDFRDAMLEYTEAFHFLSDVIKEFEDYLPRKSYSLKPVFESLETLYDIMSRNFDEYLTGWQDSRSEMPRSLSRMIYKLVTEYVQAQTAMQSLINNYSRLNY